MTYNKGLTRSLVAVAALLTGLTVAAAQTPTGPALSGTSVQTSDVQRVDFRNGGRGDCGARGGRNGGGMMSQIIDRADADGDRSVTQEELDTFRAATVAGADASGEGDISLDEFQQIYLDLTRERMVDAFQNLDADGDGVVTQAEMDKRFGDIVSRMDNNDDGKLDRDDRQGRGGMSRGGMNRGGNGQGRGN